VKASLPSLVAAAVVAAGALHAGEAVAEEEKAKNPSKAQVDPDEPVARPDAEDLRGGHWLFTLDGGVWAPSTGLYHPDATALGAGGPELGIIDAGGTLHGHVGWALNRYLQLNLLDGGFAYAPSLNPACDCGLWSIDVGPSLQLHPTQGFAFDPWVSYGAGYRLTILSLAGAAERVQAMDVAKLAVGGTWYPDPMIGFGPYLEVDIGVRTSGDISGYGIFHAGLGVTFDPFAAGTAFTPGVASR